MRRHSLTLPTQPKRTRSRASIVAIDPTVFQLILIIIIIIITQKNILLQTRMIALFFPESSLRAPHRPLSLHLLLISMASGFS